MGSDGWYLVHPIKTQRFNSRSRMGSDFNPVLAYVPRVVSIRAPAWGATAAQLRHDGFIGVSIRAPAWGATPPQTRYNASHQVSIRAPAWGATHMADADAG